MDGGRSYRGWFTAITVAITLTLVILVVEKHLRIPTSRYFAAPGNAPAVGASTEHRGVVMTMDPGLIGTGQLPLTDRVGHDRRSSTSDSILPASVLRKPPEPAADVVLSAPVALEDLTQLPLYGQSSKLSYLMEAIDSAFDSPIKIASARLSTGIDSETTLRRNRYNMLPSPGELLSRLPEPRALLTDLDELQSVVNTASLSRTDEVGMVYVTRLASLSEADVDRLPSLHAWTLQTKSSLVRLVSELGLEHAESDNTIQQLKALAAQGNSLGQTLATPELAYRINCVVYALQRRAEVWQTVRDCIASSHSTLDNGRIPLGARQQLADSIQAVEAALAQTGDREAWRKYLLIDELTSWVQSPQDIWQEGNSLALTVLSRLHWQRTNEAQHRFLAQVEFENLASNLSAWGREPVDYRQLLSDLEQLESDPITRTSNSIAQAVQVLRLSSDDHQLRVATAINDHYRNANIRLSVTDDLVQRLLPNGDYEIRPVRQRILGADTRGDSAVKTQLRVRLIPDATAWNIDLEVHGDLHSNTRSSKGPAVFHNFSNAQILAHRYLRLDPLKFDVSAEPTNVSSQDYLRKMSTDYDGLPIVGDFARLLVREQFDQKRGLAQRISRRIIASETDAELDQQLQAGMAKAEKEIRERLVGPLEQLHLNPMVVSMNTTEERLSIRYRVANETQMAAYTPRPRAPTESLLSMQLHQSAINNAIDRIGLSGRIWTIAELYARIGEVFQQSDWVLPDDIPDDITIKFADTRPATVELDEGRLRLTLRIAELNQPDRLHIERFIVSSSYIPAAEGLSAELIRDGVVEIVSSHDRLKLRIIFAKVFVSNPKIPLISERWVDDPRAEGLAVSQVEIRDGWLAVAVSQADSTLAAEVASRAQQLRNVK